MQDVLEVKNGMERNVHVQVDLTSMELFVWSVSTVKFGTLDQNHVFVRRDTSGMEISVRKCSSVREEECIMKLSNNVFAKKEISGTDMLVWFSLNVAVEKDGMKKNYSVNVLKASTGMDSSVFSA